MNSDQAALQQSIEGFLRSLEAKSRSRATISAYRTDLLQFVIWLMENNCSYVGPAQLPGRPQ